MNQSFSFAYCLTLAAGMLATSPSANAQTAPAPQLPPPPSHGEWVINYKRETARNPDPKSEDGLLDPSQVTGRIEKRDYTVNGELGRCITHYSDGKTVAMYIVGRIGVEENPQDPTDLILDNFSFPLMDAEEFLKHYPGLEWVRPELYKGTVSFHDIPCHFFAEEASPLPEISATPLLNPPSDPACGRQAWFGMDGRPLAYKDRDLTATFTFKAPDAVSSILLPERFRAKFQRYFEASSHGKLEANEKQ